MSHPVDGPKWRKKKKSKLPTQVLLVGGRGGVHAPAAAVSPSLGSALAVGRVPLDAGRTRLLDRHLIQRRRRFHPDAVIVVLGIASD